MLEDLVQIKTNLSYEQIRDILSCFKSINVKKNAHLLERDSVASQLFFIKKGCLRL